MAILLAENMILGLRRAVNLMQAVRLVLHELDRNFFREEKLAGMCGVAGRIGLGGDFAAFAHFEMDVVGAALVEAGKNRLKVHRAVRSCDLNTAQESELVGGIVLGRPSHASWRSGTIAGMLGI